MEEVGVKEEVRWRMNGGVEEEAGGEELGVKEDQVEAREEEVRKGERRGKR